MLSDLWAKFFLNKFLQNIPDIFTFRNHYNVCIKFGFIWLFQSCNHIIFIAIIMSWNIQFELTVLELVFRTSSHFGRVGLWCRIDFIWLFQSWNHMVFIVTFMGYFVWIHHSENISNLQGITKSCIHANWFHLIISVVKSYCIIRTICWDIRIELIFHHAVVKREQKGASAVSLSRRNLTVWFAATQRRLMQWEEACNINQTNPQPSIKMFEILGRHEVHRRIQLCTRAWTKFHLKPIRGCKYQHQGSGTYASSCQVEVDQSSSSSVC